MTSPGYSLPFRTLVVLVTSLGIIITPIYLLAMLRQMFYGISLRSLPCVSQDASPREVFVSVALLGPMLGLGCYPPLALQLWDTPIHRLSDQLRPVAFQQRLAMLPTPVRGMPQPMVD